MSVSVVVPWLDAGCADRDRALDYVGCWWAEHYPTWPLVLGVCSGTWSKGAAIADALDRVATPLVVVADADVYLDDPQAAARAVDAVENGAVWAIPHRLVWRLTPAATARVLGGGETPSAAVCCEEPPYRGVECGGLLTAPTETLRGVPCDPRFEGWGGQDWAWSFALRCLVGAPWRGSARCVHLWHPPQDRPSRQQASPANEALRLRYARARRNPQAMRTLAGEALAAL